ncbi:MAG: hypothetical protein LBO64_03355 [Desulfovibrio sp.]|jgi:hypothetical protein|nr:hypothetical protein [Desulfovibrio sp.]
MAKTATVKVNGRNKRINIKVWRMSDFQEAAREAAHPCFVRLYDIALHGDDGDARDAIKEIFNRAFGKVGQPIAVTGADGGPIEVKQILSPEFVAALREINGDGNDAA